MAQTVTIDRLLNLVPDAPGTVVNLLQAHPDLAPEQDAHGYSLIHAAASYGHSDLLTLLIKDYNVDANLKDEDGETALFSVEDIAMTKKLLELGTDMTLRNNDGQTAAEKLDDEDEQPAVAAFLRQAADSSPEAAVNSAPAARNMSLDVNGTSTSTQPPPPLPQGVRVNVGTMQADDVGSEPDPEFRRRIEELAARGDFEGEEGQRELRNLVTDALSGFSNQGQGTATRRRLD